MGVPRGIPFLFGQSRAPPAHTSNGGILVLKEMLENVRAKMPLIHCITNYVTVNDCANILLACGGSPIMADDGNEVEEITALCQGLYLNIGTLNERTIVSMLKAGKKANALSHPILLDPVGAGASNLRTTTTQRLMDEIRFSVIRGNVSEIKTVSLGKGTTKGVDADISDRITPENQEESVAFAKALSARTGAVIVITGAIDIIADNQKAYIIRNGHPMMSKITGTGCMLSAMITAFIAANPSHKTEAATAAVCAMGLGGELAYEKMQQTQSGTGSFRTYLMDAVSLMEGDLLEGGAKIESR